MPLIVDGVPTQPSQMNRQAFLVELEQQVTVTASAALGPQWQAVDCPYIEQWFAAHQATPAVDLERLARKYTGTTAKTARDYFATINARLAVGIAKWRAEGDVSADLAAAGLANAAVAAGASQPVAAGSPAAQRKLTTDGGASPAAVARELGPGQALDSATAQQMGDAFGQDVGHVQVHTGEVAARKASELDARAFTVGSHIGFASGAYQPGTPLGDALLAHELAHVHQQRRASADPVVANAPIGPESTAAEHDADRATRSAVTRLADKNAPRANVQVDSGYQLQRCSTSDPTIPTAAMKGQWEDKAVAKQKSRTNEAGDWDISIKALRTLGTPQKTEAAALALVKTNGASGAVTLESGMYIAYAVGGMNNGGRDFGMTVENPRCEPGVVALVTAEMAVYRPGQYDPGAKGLQETDTTKYKQSADDPFQGYKDALAGGGDLETVDPKVIVPAFEAAMTDTAFSALAHSEREVREKQPKFDKGLGGVPDTEVALIRDTAAKLLPIQKALDAAKQKKEGGLALAQTPGGGELAQKKLEEANKEIATYGPQRNAIRQAYPMLARLSTTELETFTQMTDEQRIKKLGGELPGILSDRDFGPGEIKNLSSGR
ncbi:MAG TPA: DUF4157 domain-containing protein [Kofleriaceae bacterium]|nr:DUF4157 domain-containing protein [Kofleriaceae bacterium]